MAASKLPVIGGDPTFREGVVSGFLLILFSELGDKTFFIALLLALKQSQGLVFVGTFGALGVMTVISVALGQVLHQVDELLPANSLPWDDIFAAVLLVFFGIKTLLDAKDADESAAEERGEAEKEVLQMGDGKAMGFVLSTFTLVFLAEWGDKSFLATIALAAASSPTGVVLGAVGGHGVATGIAVVGGSYLSRFLSEKVVAYVGGSLFLVFAASTIYDIIGKVSS
ncbi:g3472 [Coccomyxa viridis]|uniref:GDT1 family protein n=1 Tax=Coccomyxa viridis TaxID=1274662 RepID=A0ABP1FMW4_9CHLO